MNGASRAVRVGVCLGLAGCGTTHIQIKAMPTPAFADAWDAPPRPKVAPPVVREAPVDRAHVKSVGIKCAAMPLATVDLKPEVAKVLDEVLLSELQQAGLDAVGPEDINAMLGFERLKDAAGCDEGSCIAEIGGALGVDYLVVGKIAMLQGTSVVTLKLMDVRKTLVLARANRTNDQGEKALPRTIAAVVAAIVRDSKL